MPLQEISAWKGRRLWLYTLLYLFIGLLFIIKYPGRYGLDPLLLSVGYVVFVVAGTWLALHGSAFLARLSAGQLLVIVLLVAASLSILMFQFDPDIIRNARYKLLNQSVGMLLEGSFPYGDPMPAHHSGFPFWFVIAAPFFIVGEIGLLHILAFLLGAFVLLRIDHARSPAGILALAASPAFLYEIVVRSGITTNMILVVAYVFMTDRVLKRNEHASAFLLGLIGGLVLSTRGVVFLIFAAYLGFYARNTWRRAATLLAGWLVSFCATILPFVLWDWDRFLAVGPFMHQLQLTRLAGWLVVPAVVLAFLLGRKRKTLDGVFEMVGLFLFLGVAASFCTSLVSNGLAASVMDSRFDISYFCLALPFIVVTWMRALNRATASRS